ncbi:lipoate-protein ligase A [Lactococcus termiticola]|uniref:lipoate--protein ligase n=2 Tax=Lactococcus termiticola TaxID=2169526 RepID=A0A2R5HIG0_9LACT|nr:lipoate-protein ligase A [Lactococcus termiticola]
MDPIVKALQSLGLSADYNSRNDLTLAGKKISGNAQATRDNRTLHHGSLLYATDLSKMSEYLNVPAYKLKSKGIRSVKSRTINIQEILVDKWSPEVFGEKMLAELLKPGTRVYELTDADRRSIDELAQKKWRSWDWNFGKNPDVEMTIKRVQQFEGGQLEVQLSLVNGRIHACELTGDFFALEDLEDFKAILIGLPYERAEIARLLEGRDGMIYRMSPAEILACFFKSER